MAVARQEVPWLAAAAYACSRVLFMETILAITSPDRPRSFANANLRGIPTALANARFLARALLTCAGAEERSALEALARRCKTSQPLALCPDRAGVR